MDNCHVFYRPLTIKRILLIYPFAVSESYHLETVIKGGAFVEAPLGIGYISSYLQQNFDDVEVRIVDANALAVKHILSSRVVDMPALWEMLKQRIRDFAPDMVGVSCLFHNIALLAHKTCAAIRETAPRAVVAMGGNYPSGSPEIAMADRNLDFLLFSEGEKSFAGLIGALRGGFEPSAMVDGIAYRSDVMTDLTKPLSAAAVDRTVIHHVAKGAFTKSLEDYPWPDRRDFDMEFYATYARHFAFRTLKRGEVRLATMTASRGCPFRCSFCSSKDFWGRQIRYREPAVVVDEIERLIADHDINTFVFNDDNIMSDRKKVVALCNEIKRRNLKIHWLSGGGIQVSAMKPDVIQALIETGLNQFNLAIETGNPKTLRRINKPLTVGVAEGVIAEIRRYDHVWIGSNFITGFYFETLDDVRETLAYAAGLDLDWRSIYAFQPLPGTDDYKSCVELGYVKEWGIWDADHVGDLVALDTANFSAIEIRNLNYLSNLEHNFLRNRNLRLNPAQAIRDFDYVIEMAPDHAVAYYARSLAEMNLGEARAAALSLRTARNIVEKTSGYAENRFKSNLAMTAVDVRWGDYFAHFGVDLDAEVARLQAVAV